MKTPSEQSVCLETWRITPQCRESRRPNRANGHSEGDDLAFNTAMENLRAVYRAQLARRGDGITLAVSISLEAQS